MEKRKDINPNRGIHEYGNVEFADDINKKYPLDNEEHIRAAWSYFHMPKNYSEYNKKDRDIIKNKIIRAWKEKINPEGPPAKDLPL